MNCEVENLVNPAPSLFAADVDDEIESAPHVLLDGIETEAAAPAHHQGGGPMDGSFRAAGVDGRQRPAVAGIHGIEQCPRLRPAYLADDDAVGTMTKDGLEQVVEGNLVAVRIGLRLRGDDMRLADMQLRRVFDDQDAVLFRDRVGQYTGERGLAA
jgi:hypothetical protein